MHFILTLAIIMMFINSSAVGQDALGKGNALDKNRQNMLPQGTRNYEIKRNSILQGQNFNAGIGRANDASLRLIKNANNEESEDAYQDAINNSPWYWNNWSKQSAQYLTQGDNSYFNPNFIDNWSTSPQQMYSGRSIRAFSHAWNASTARKYGGSGELDYPTDWSVRQIEQYRLGQVLGSGQLTAATDTSPIPIGRYSNSDVKGYLSASPLTGVSFEATSRPVTALGFSAWDAARASEDEEVGVGSISMIRTWQTEQHLLTAVSTDNLVAAPEQYLTLLDTIARRAVDTEDTDSNPDALDWLDSQYAALQNQLAGTITTEFLIDEEDEESFSTPVKVEDEAVEMIATVLRHGERIKHFTSENKTRFDELVLMGEKALGKGEYFESQRRFKQALRFIPGHPMATAGLAHANIGAGLFLSAGNVLQSLLSFQPEMIDVTYEPQLLPPRIELVRAAIAVKNRLDEERDGSTYAFLLAYLGHQLQDKEMLSLGLMVLQQRSGANDPFVQLLSSVWTVEEVTLDSSESQSE